jgi:hypothetical protein
VFRIRRRSRATLQLNNNWMSVEQRALEIKPEWLCAERHETVMLHRWQQQHALRESKG